MLTRSDRAIYPETDPQVSVKHQWDKRADVARGATLLWNFSRWQIENTDLSMA